jgi:predicted RNase H-like HicB family nuclease
VVLALDLEDLVEPEYIELTFKIEPEDDGFVSFCQELGIASQGDSVDEALENIKDATLTLLDELSELGDIAEFLANRGVAVKRGQPSAVETPKTVEINRGEIVSVLAAFLGQSAAYAR